jgi:NADPH-ferrihemoprotein reductase
MILSVHIGPGTGLAPFRGFIQERHECRSQGQAIGETVLYFGCRHRLEDYLYEDELNAYVEQQTLQLHVAFSRDQHDKSYVTHLLKRDAQKLWQWIRHENASIYVCG